MELPQWGQPGNPYLEHPHGLQHGAAGELVGVFVVETFGAVYWVECLALSLKSVKYNVVGVGA